MHRKFFVVMAISLSLLLSGCSVFSPATPNVSTTQVTEQATELPCDINAIDQMAGMYMGELDIALQPIDKTVAFYNDPNFGTPAADVELLVEASTIDDLIEVARQVAALTVIYEPQGVTAIVSQETARSMIDPVLYDEINADLTDVCTTTWYISTFVVNGQLPTPPCTDESCKEETENA